MATPHELRDRHLRPMVERAARLQAHGAKIAEARRVLRARAVAQRDATDAALEAAQAWLARHPHNHLIALRVEHLLRERARLDSVLYRLTRPDDTEPGHHDRP